MLRLTHNVDWLLQTEAAASVDCSLVAALHFQLYEDPIAGFEHDDPKPPGASQASDTLV